MKCNECGSTDNNYDERLGEHTCADCGLVLVTEMFEETTHALDRVGDSIHSADKGSLGSVIAGKGSYKFNKFGKNSVMSKHLQNGLLHCHMTMSAIAPQIDLKDRIESLYIELLNNQKLVSYTYEERAASIVHYALKENGTPYTFKQICGEFECEKKRVMRLTRKINQHYGNRIIRQTNPTFSLQRTLNLITDDIVFHSQAKKVLERIELFVNNLSYNKGQSYFSAICWITANLNLRKDITSVLISEKTGFTRWNIHRETQNLLSLLKVSCVKEIKGKDISKIGE
jgi:transcription initiation factor TFIIIB Brf1 subunit/transcription initiation factor TFIIB